MNDSANVQMLVWGDVFYSSLDNVLSNNYSDKDLERRIGLVTKSQRVVLFFIGLGLKLYWMGTLV